jgi:hypothetical protein
MKKWRKKVCPLHRRSEYSPLREKTGTCSLLTLSFPLLAGFQYTDEEEVANDAEVALGKWGWNGYCLA